MKLEREEMRSKKEILTGRICSVQRESYKILYNGNELPATLKGKFYHNNNEFPVVGDYVRFQYNEFGNSRIEELCQRKSLLKRADQSGHAIAYVKTMLQQTMIANFDYVFILTSLNDNYNTNRIARYVSLTLQGGGIPVVILTKADLCENIEEYVKQVKAFSEQVKVHVISSIKGVGLDELRQYLKPDVTIALLGSSGVGKSTLVNALAGKEIMKTAAIREKDSKGRHTTTSRELMVLDNGVVLIDTPGMRELGMVEVNDGIDEAFSDIEELMAGCRFSDCKHKTEPGCAVLKALDDGSLSEEKWNLYKSLENESSKNTRMMAVQMRRKRKA